MRGHISPTAMRWDMHRQTEEKTVVYELSDTKKVNRLFAHWEETMIWSCLQGVMGKIYVTDPISPRSACVFVGSFAFYAGEAERELVTFRLSDFVIASARSDEWEMLIAECFPEARRVTRYATKKDTVFDRNKLRTEAERIPDGYTVCRIDGELYGECLKIPFARDFVSSFSDREDYLKNGIGFVVMKNGEIVSGASSYSAYVGGIEIEVDTAVPERRKNLASAACARLICECLDFGVYPSWDAQNKVSLHLAEKLGYEFSHEYTSYEIKHK